MTQNEKKSEQARFGESLFNALANSLDRVKDSQKDLDELFLQSLEKQKEHFNNLTEDVNKIQEEQKNLFSEISELAKDNLQKVLGPDAGVTLEQWNPQLDEVSSRLLTFIETPYKESLKILNQSQDRFQETIKYGISQQQRVRDELTEQIKGSQKILFDIFEANSKAAFGLIK